MADAPDPYAPVPKCYECLSENVAVKIIDLAGCEHWLCAEDWAAANALHDKIHAMLAEATRG
jgi:hypothetical protein